MPARQSSPGTHTSNSALMCLFLEACTSMRTPACTRACPDRGFMIKHRLRVSLPAKTQAVGLAGLKTLLPGSVRDCLSSPTKRAAVPTYLPPPPKQMPANKPELLPASEARLLWLRRLNFMAWNDEGILVFLGMPEGGRPASMCTCACARWKHACVHACMLVRAYTCGHRQHE